MPTPSRLAALSAARPMNGTTTTVKTNIADVIVGAGVSTCAPVVPPK